MRDDYDDDNFMIIVRIGLKNNNDDEKIQTINQGSFLEKKIKLKTHSTHHPSYWKNLQ